MLAKFFTHLASASRRNASPQFTIVDYRVCQNDCTGRDDCMLSNNRPVHHHGTHTNEGAPFHMRTMNNGVVSDADVTFEYGLTFFKRAMDDGTILDVDPFAHRNGGDVSSNDGREPHCAVSGHVHISNNGGVGCQPHRRVQIRMDTSARKDDGHELKVIV